MNYRILGLVAGLLGVVLLFQATAPLPNAKDLKNSQVVNPYLYEIKLNGKTSHILGTFHLGFRLVQFPAHVEQVLENSQIFLGEDIQGDDEKPKLSKIAKFENSFLKPSTRLAFRQRGINLDRFSKQDEILKICLQYTFWEAGPEWSRLDRELELKARAQKKQIVALDESEDVTIALERATLICNPDQLVEQISPWQASRQFLRNYQKYLNGDEGRIVPDADVDEMLLISKRNQKWLPKIIKAHQNGPAFIAVGALHLGGEQGLLSLLKQAGFVVERSTPATLSDRRGRQRIVGPGVFGVAAF